MRKCDDIKLITKDKQKTKCPLMNRAGYLTGTHVNSAYSKINVCV